MPIAPANPKAEPLDERPLRVLVVDDNEDDIVLLQERLTAADAPRCRLLSAADADEMWDVLAKDKPQVIILDFRLSLETGLNVLKNLRERGIALPVIAWTGAGSEYVAADMVAAGALGYLNKADLDGERLVELLGKASQQIREHEADGPQREAFAARLANLSDREAELLPCIVAGWTNRQIAAAIFRSVETVKTHRSHLLKKLDVSGTPELIQLCLRAGIEPAGDPPEV